MCMKTVAFIDGANLHKGVLDLGWNLDYGRFRIFLKDNYGVEKAYLFLGLIPKNAELYTKLQDAGYILVFKETIYSKSGDIKGNCDAELVLKTVSDFYEKEYDRAVIVSGDGDFACLVKFLVEKNVFEILLAPHNKKCSILLKRASAKITFLNDLKPIISIEDNPINEKAPDGDKTP